MINHILVKRIITALMLAPPVVLFLFYGNLISFWFVSSFILMLAVFEWKNFFQSQQIIKGIILGSNLIILFALYQFYLQPLSAKWIEYLVIFVACLWGMAPLVLIAFAKDKLKPFSEKFMFILGLFIFLGCWLSWQFLFIKSAHGLYLIYLLFLVWLADIGAYFSGKFFGKHKLAVKISPGKTWEGVAGGILTSMLFAITVGYLNFLSTKTIFFWVLISMVTTIYSVVGDLFMSVLKRQKHLKDTGNLLPGHGGILDRIDSLLSASPLFFSFLLLSTGF